MARVSIIEIEEGIYGTNDTNRGNQMMAVAGEALAGYVHAHSEHRCINIQEKSLTAKEIEKYDSGYKGGDVKIDDEAIVGMLKLQAEAARANGEQCVVGIRSVSPFFSHCARLALQIKQAIPEAKIVIGGYHSSGMAGREPEAKAKNLYIGEKYKSLQAELGDSMELIDAYAIGEGEVTFLETINAFETGQDLSGVKGLIYRKNGEVVYTGPRELMRVEGHPEECHTDETPTGTKVTLELPEPYRLMAIPEVDDQGQVSGFREIPSSAACTQVGSSPGDEDIRGEVGSCLSRGCYQDCTFCSSRFISNGKMRFRDPKVVAAEIAKYHDDPRFQTNFVYFYDLTFNAFYEKHANQFCQEMINFRNAEGKKVFGGQEVDNVHWFCLAEIFNFKDGEEDKVKESLRLMSEAGCTKIGYGIEGFTLNDIIRIKHLEKAGQDEREQGVDRFAKIAWVLKQSVDAGIFTRGYFMWGTEFQDEASMEKAMSLMTKEVPAKVFEDLGKLRELVKFVFEQQEQGNLEPDIETFARETLKLSDDELQDHCRLLETDHLRIAYETPYPNTVVGQERKLRYLKYARDGHGFFLHDAKGKLIPMRFAEGDQPDEPSKPLEVHVTEKGVEYLLGGQPVNPADYGLEIEERWQGQTLDEAIAKGWDDWELGTQEVPMLETGIPIEKLVKHQGEIINSFYSDPAYHRSMESKVREHPDLAEGAYAWQKFWNERNARPAFREDGQPYFNFLSEESKALAEAHLCERLAGMGLTDEEMQEWIDSHFLESRRPAIDEIHAETAPEEGWGERISG